MYWDKEVEFETLLGKTIEKISNVDGTEIHITTTDGSEYKMYHEQACCENVSIEDVEGSFDDLIGSPLTLVEETSNSESDSAEYDYSRTWTFYRLATVKGYVTIRWLGESNGYYSESVYFVKLK